MSEVSGSYNDLCHRIYGDANKLGKEWLNLKSQVIVNVIILTNHKGQSFKVTYYGVDVKERQL